MGTDWSAIATLVTAIGGAVAAIVGAVGGVIVAVKKVSPREREQAVVEASSTDTAQNQRLEQLEGELRRLRGDDPDA